MADPSTVPEASDDSRARPAHGPGDPAPAYPGAPRWVKRSALVALIVTILIVLAMALGGGNHGPGRHLPSGGAGTDAASVVQGVWPR